TRSHGESGRDRGFRFDDGLRRACILDGRVIGDRWRQNGSRWLRLNGCDESVPPIAEPLMRGGLKMLNVGPAVGLMGNQPGDDRPDADGRRKGAGCFPGSSARHVLPAIRNFGLTLSLISLSACGTTRRYVEQPHLTIDQSEADVRHAVTELYGQET